MVCQYRRVKECVRCGMTRYIHGRGLCGQCYYPYRDLYPVLRVTRPFHRDYEDRLWTRERGQPTSAVPGSPEKIEVLAQRASEHRPLFHPEDA